MDNQYEQAVRYLQSNLVAGYAPDQLQRQLVQSGWEPQLVARALQQASYNLSNPQQQASQQVAAGSASGLARKPVVFVLLTLVGVGLALFLFVITNPSSNSDGELAASGADNQDETSIVESEAAATVQQFASEVASVSFAYPLEWTVNELSPGSNDSFNWQATPPTNGEVSSQLEAKYGIVPSPDQGLSIDPVVTDALADPIARDLAFVDIKIRSQPTFAVEDSLADWKKIADGLNEQSDISLGGFQNIEVSGFDGLKYESDITLGGVKLSTIEYVVIASNQRLEVSVFPANTNHIDLIDELVNSFTFE